MSSLQINNGHISFEMGKEMFCSRVTAEPTKEPQTKNHRPIPFHLVLLGVLFDVFKRAKTNPSDMHNAASMALSQRL